jgi:lysine/ornithine N-monooxygenase
MVRKHKTKHTPHRIVPFTSVIGSAKRIDQVVLEIMNTLDQKMESSTPFDFVFVASGYSRTVHRRLLEPIQPLSDGFNGQLTADSDYRVGLKQGVVSPGCGIWLVDGFERAEEDAFSYMALRTGKLLKSLSSQYQSKDTATEGVYHKYITEYARL